VRRRVVVAFLVLVAIVLLLLELPLAVTFARRERAALDADVERDATSLAVLAEEAIEDPGGHDVAALARRFGASTDGAVVVVDAAGRPIDPDPSPPAELSAALRAALDGARNGHATVGRDAGVAYAAEPVGSGAEVHGAVLVTHRDDDAERRIHQLWVALGAIAAVALGVAWLVGDRLARWAIRPLRSLDERAAALGRGELGTRAEKISGPPEVIELARTFNDMAEQLEELVSGQRRFVADASHQLRSPLAALRLRLDALDLADSDAARVDVDAAIAETVRLSRLIDGLLTLAQAEGARPERRLTDVVAVVKGRRAAWSAFADEQGVDLRAELPDDPVEVPIVDGHLEQILDNHRQRSGGHPGRGRCRRHAGRAGQLGRHRGARGRPRAGHGPRRDGPRLRPAMAGSARSRLRLWPRTAYRRPTGPRERRLPPSRSRLRRRRRRRRHTAPGPHVASGTLIRLDRSDGHQRLKPSTPASS
jgi:signal transduction histidine kinase